jgi:cell division transport system permease protein
VIPRVASAFRRALRIIADRPRATAWTLVAATCALVVVGIAGLVIDNVDAPPPPARGGASMVVYLGDGVERARADLLVAQLHALPGAERVELVDAAESRRRLVRALGTDAALLDGVDPASLPASIEVTLAAGMRDVAGMSAAVTALRGAPGVDDIVVEERGDDGRAHAAAAIRSVAWLAALVVGALALAAALAALRLRFATDRDELAVAHLLGASPAFVVVPTAIAGALHGLAAALLALGVLVLAIVAYDDAIATALRDALGASEPVAPTATAIAMFVAIGAMLGTIGGALGGGARAVR